MAILSSVSAGSILSGAYIHDCMVSEFGCLPTSLLPLANYRLYCWQIESLAGSVSRIILATSSLFQLDESSRDLFQRNDMSVYFIEESKTVGPPLYSGLEQLVEDVDYVLIIFGNTSTADLKLLPRKPLSAALTLPIATQGQAETVHMWLYEPHITPDGPITIFNVDAIRSNLCFSASGTMLNISEFLEILESKGDSWFFSKAVSEDDMAILEIAEKLRTSDSCFIGLCYFTQVGNFIQVFKHERKKTQEVSDSQLWNVDPLYNTLIKNSKKIIAAKVDRSQLIPQGALAEYKNLRSGDGYI